MKSFIFCVLLCFSSVAMADKGFWLATNTGLYNFDSERQLDDKMFVQVESGFRQGKWGGAVSWLRLDTNEEVLDTGVRWTQWKIEGLWFPVGKVNSLEPYLALGIGEARYDGKAGNEYETDLDMGVGVHWFFAERWSLKADFRGIIAADDESVDNSVTLGVAYHLGAETSGDIKVYSVE